MLRDACASAAAADKAEQGEREEVLLSPVAACPAREDAPRSAPDPGQRSCDRRLCCSVSPSPALLHLAAADDPQRARSTSSEEERRKGQDKVDRPSLPAPLGNRAHPGKAIARGSLAFVTGRRFLVGPHESLVATLPPADCKPHRLERRAELSLILPSSRSTCARASMVRPALALVGPSARRLARAR